MQALATAAGGEGATFLSPTYRGSSIPHRWMCGGGEGGREGGKEGGHVFEKTPNYVRKGLVIGRAFCRECEREKKKNNNNKKKKEEGEGGKERREGGKDGGRAKRV